MGRKRLPPEDQTSTVVLRLRDRLLTQAESLIGPGESMQDFIRQAIEAELDRRQRDGLHREAARALTIYRGLMGMAQERRAVIVAERLQELEKMSADVATTLAALKAQTEFEQSRQEPEPSNDDIFAE
jgi:hypothetical protein